MELIDENAEAEEVLRLASVAAQFAAEAEIEAISQKHENHSKIQQCIVLHDPKSPLIKFMRQEGRLSRKKNGRYYIYSDVYIVKFKGEKKFRLRIEYYPFWNTFEEPVVTKAYRAIHYVLSQIDPQLTIETNQIMEVRGNAPNQYVPSG